MKEYVKKIKDIPENEIVYVDETGIDNYLYREYARAPRGKVVYEKISGRKFKRTGIVAAQVGKKLIAEMTYEGTMNSEFFESWFRKALIPSVHKNAVIVMDNASFHRKKYLHKLAEEHDIRIIFLPPYSPEYNPIENTWHVFKKRVCELLRVCSSFDEAVKIVFETFKVY